MNIGATTSNAYHAPAPHSGTGASKSQSRTAPSVSASASGDIVEISASAKVGVMESMKITEQPGTMRATGSGVLNYVPLLLPASEEERKNCSADELRAYSEQNVKEAAFAKFVNGLGISVRTTGAPVWKLGEEPSKEKAEQWFSCEKYGSFQTDDIIGFLRERYGNG